MDRTQILDLMGTLKLYGMRSAYDEVMATGIKRQHEPPRIVGDLLQSEIAEKQARSIRYQMTVAKLPLAKDIDEFDFAGTPDQRGAWSATSRPAASSPTSATSSSSAAPAPARRHLAIAIARALIRAAPAVASSTSSTS